MAKGIKTGGRKPGSLNKVTSTVKDNVVAVFNEIGGTKEMAKWAKENRTEFYRLYAKLIPTEVHGSGTNGEIVLKITSDDTSVL